VECVGTLGANQQRGGDALSNPDSENEHNRAAVENPLCRERDNEWGPVESTAEAGLREEDFSPSDQHRQNPPRDCPTQRTEDQPTNGRTMHGGERTADRRTDHGAEKDRQQKNTEPALGDYPHVVQAMRRLIERARARPASRATRASQSRNATDG